MVEGPAPEATKAHDDSDTPDHPHGGPPGQDPDFVPPGHGGTPPGQEDTPEGEEDALHPEHPIVVPDDEPQPEHPIVTPDDPEKPAEGV